MGFMACFASLSACTGGTVERAFDARLRECGATRGDFRIDRRGDRPVLTPVRPDDAMDRNFTDSQRCVTRWARSNGFDVSAEAWGN
jgi:hypothetical protein